MPARISAAIPHGQNKNVRCGRSSEPQPPGQTAEQSQRRSLAPQDISSRPAGPRTPFDGNPYGSAHIRSAVARILLDREEQFRHRLIEAAAEEMHCAYY